MITVIKTDTGFAQISGNPVLTSLDGERKAPLRTIMHESWSDEDRAAFGIYQAEPFVVPEGMIITGNPVYKKTKSGKVVQTIPVESAPAQADPSPLDEMAGEIAALKARIEALEASK